MMALLHDADARPQANLLMPGSQVNIIGAQQTPAMPTAALLESVLRRHASC